jgi:hypothetical protein
LKDAESHPNARWLYAEWRDTLQLACSAHKDNMRRNSIVTQVTVDDSGFVKKTGTADVTSQKLAQLGKSTI